MERISNFATCLVINRHFLYHMDIKTGTNDRKCATCKMAKKSHLKRFKNAPKHLVTEINNFLFEHLCNYASNTPTLATIYDDLDILGNAKVHQWMWSVKRVDERKRNMSNLQVQASYPVASYPVLDSDGVYRVTIQLPDLYEEVKDSDEIKLEPVLQPEPEPVPELDFNPTTDGESDAIEIDVMNDLLQWSEELIEQNPIQNGIMMNHHYLLQQSEDMLEQKPMLYTIQDGIIN